MYVPMSFQSLFFYTPILLVKKHVTRIKPSDRINWWMWWNKALGPNLGHKKLLTCTNQMGGNCLSEKTAWMGWGQLTAPLTQLNDGCSWEAYKWDTGSHSKTLWHPRKKNSAGTLTHRQQEDTGKSHYDIIKGRSRQEKVRHCALTTGLQEENRNNNLRSDDSR